MVTILGNDGVAQPYRRWIRAWDAAGPRTSREGGPMFTSRDPEKAQAKADKRRDQSLTLISQRRGRIIAKLNLEKFNLTGGAFSGEIGEYAREIHYLDLAYDSIKNRGERLPHGGQDE
jgi:hypothetical protein